MPAWNAASVIGETIRSVQAQSMPDWELIIADDCSRDATCDLVEGFAASDPRIRLLRATANTGPALARQRAIDAATGRHLAFLDSDDLWLPQKLERQLEFMSRHQAALSYTSYRRMNADGSKIGRVIGVPACLTYEQLLHNTAIATLTAMVDREIAGAVRMTNEGYDDYCLWLSILKRGHVARGLQEDLARYRVLGNSVSSKPMRSARWVWNIYRNVERLPMSKAALCLASYGLRAAAKRIR